MASNGGFIDAQSRLNALQSQLAPTPAQMQIGTTAQAPTSSVGTFKNQQLGGLLSGTTGVTGGSTPSTQATATQVQPQGPGTSPVAAMAQDTLSSVKAAQQRTNNLAAIANSKRASQASQGSSGGSGGGGGMGMAYQPNGQLSGARNKALQTAFSYVGNPYQLGGTSHNGIDCSGLVMMVYDQFGYGGYLDSHLAGHQAAAIPGVRTSVNNLRPGDIVAWRDGSHIAIYAGNGMIVSAADYGEGVKYQPVWGNVFGIALRLPGE